jgi:tRNA A-37 threonylcarbamoyl transferase component Bud32
MSVGGPATPHSEDPLLNRVLSDRYRILEKLGEGGMGVVYLAEHVVIEKKIALKVLFPDLTRRDDLVQRFLQEAKSASRIGHENVIDITDFGQSPEGYVFIAMEYLIGQDLGQVLKASGPMPWPRAQPIILQIVKALRAAHERGIVHRDMKPENVFVVPRDDGREFVKVLDFGIAKVLGLEEDAPRLTRTGMIFGTPEYMSPEQAQGQQVDHRVDIYAVGCLLYHMLTGDVPFRAESFMGILSKHMLETPIAPRVRNAAIEPAVEAVINRAMEKDPGKRFQTMREFVEALVPLGHLPDLSGAISMATGSPSPAAPAGGMPPREVTKPLPAVSAFPATPATPVLPVAPGLAKQAAKARTPAPSVTEPLPAATRAAATSLPYVTTQIGGREGEPLAQSNPEARRSQTELLSRDDSDAPPRRRQTGNLVLVVVGVGAVLLIGVVFLALRGSSGGGTAAGTPSGNPIAPAAVSPPQSPAATPRPPSAITTTAAGALAPSGIAPAGNGASTPGVAAGSKRAKDGSRHHRTSREAIDSLLQQQVPTGEAAKAGPATGAKTGTKTGATTSPTPRELKNPFVEPSP